MTTPLYQLLLPEFILVTVACALLLLGVLNRPWARRFAAMAALVTLVVVAALSLNELMAIVDGAVQRTRVDAWETFRIFSFAHYIRLVTAGVGILLVLLAWPTNQLATGNTALDYGHDAGEFFALILLSITGVFVTAGANDMILLFLGIELASIPTYIMVSMSRPLPAAQEAGVKYFFLGAMAAALMLFGLSFMYGVTGETNLYQVMFDMSEQKWQYREGLGPWWTLGSVMLVAGISFKIAAVPMHFYAGDVYEGAATPVTALLSFVPKVSGFVALIRVMHIVSGGNWLLPQYLEQLLWIVAVLTMTVGNILALMQDNLKRLMAYSSIAHSGYMLVGLATMASLQGGDPVRRDALQGVLFYLAAYGLTNAAVFGVLMLLPSRHRRQTPTVSAETFDDIAGQGRRYPALGLSMAVACFSLTGLPLTVGFFGKFLLIKPAIHAGLIWLAILTVVNAAISAAYYLRIVATMFLRDAEPAGDPPARAETTPAGGDGGAIAEVVFTTPVVAAIVASVAGVLLLGVVLPMTQVLVLSAEESTRLEYRDFTHILPQWRDEDAAGRDRLRDRQP
jgi:NADH-quinone oxidoreductase subunit N